MVDFTKVKSYTSQFALPGGDNSGNLFTGGGSSAQGNPFSGGLTSGPSGLYSPALISGSTQPSASGKAFETFSVPERSNQHSSFLPSGPGNTVISASGDIRGNKLNTFA